MATFVLVPGNWLGAWAWEDVTRPLRAAGHDVHPVTLPGLAERAAEATRDTDLDTYIADLAAQIEERDLRDVVLVGHSGGNMPVNGVAARIPERLRRVVYADSGPLPRGMAQLDFNSPEEQEGVRAQVAEKGDGWLVPVPAYDPAADPVNLEGIPAERLAEMRERGTPQPYRTIAQPLTLPEPADPPPGAVISCTFAPEQVRELAASGVPAFAAMAALDLHHLPTGHWPMFSRPADLAALLAEIA